MSGNIIENTKKAAGKVKDFFSKLSKTIKFLLTPIGQAIGLIILVASLAVTIYVIAAVIQNEVHKFFHGEFAGLSTTGDYETVISSLGYSGYDSYISEELWQDYAAFEYAVLMDVAEHMYKNQDYLTTLEYVDTDGSTKKYTTSAVIPEGVIDTRYDASAITDEKWREYLVAGQLGNAPSSFTTPAKKIPGGNRKVTTPRIIYDIVNHEYEDEAVSLMPYLVVVREDIELNYFLDGLPENVWKKYECLKEIEPGDIDTYKANINPIKFSAILNRYNYNMPTSAYKEDLEEDQSKGKEVYGVESKYGFIGADLGYEDYKPDQMYYIEQETDIVYKIPLKLLINRYLPKSTLLTSWYLLKQDKPDEDGFKIDEMMLDIKRIYNAACYTQDTSGVEPIEITGYIDKETGKKVPDQTPPADEDGTPAPKKIRIGQEKVDGTRNVESVQYDDNGKVIRDDDGKAIKTSKTLKYATTNLRTMVYFEQFGIETSRYEKYKAYLGPSGDYEPYSGDEARPEAESPTITYLTKERTNFIQTLNLKLPTITYITVDDEEKTLDELDVRLKPTYSHREEKEPDLDERLKSLYLYGNETGASIEQEPPYEIMKDVVKKAEEKINDTSISAIQGESHRFINKLYIMADVGNTERVEEAKGEYIKPEELKYRLAEDYRYYNQDDQMPHWYDIYESKKGGGTPTQEDLEKAYLEAFQEIYAKSANKELIRDMLYEEIKKNSDLPMPKSPDDIEFETSSVIYTYNEQAKLYEDGSKITHNEDEKDIFEGDYKVNYYWDAIYIVEERQLQMRQAIHHRRMPVALVKYCDFWAKSVKYDNVITMNPIEYRNYKYLIPDAKTSLGLEEMKLKETAKYRVSTFKKYFNGNEENGIKENDVLDMLVQWESYAQKGGDEVTYSYMRDLYKLILYIKASGSMLNSAYNYLYISPNISNYSDEVLQKIFWLERFGVSQGEDELTEEEQNKTRTKALDSKWQNLEYDEYEECVYEVGNGDERAKVYALFPYGSSYVRAYYMLNGWSSTISQAYEAGSHDASDMVSRVLLKNILNRAGDVAEHIYYYELNRMTLYYMRNGKSKEDAFLLAENELNNTLKVDSLYSPVVAVAPGYVKKVDYDARSGFYVEIIHDYDEKTQTGEITSFYAHFKRWPLVAEGEYIGAGTVLGYEGTTGRSTGYHLHFSLKDSDPKGYLIPIFSPFYNAEKAEKILEEDETYALGTDYYTLERTILPEDALFAQNNVINGMILEDGTTVNYTPPANPGAPYKSGDTYMGSAEPAIWGNNVPSQSIANRLEYIIDLSYLYRTVAFQSGEKESGAGGIMSNSQDVIANPDCFDDKNEFAESRMKWLKWFTIQMAEYKSPRVVPYYNGPADENTEIKDEEALKDLKAMQDSLRSAGYYQKAGYKWEDVPYGAYSEELKNIVKIMQKDLQDKGYSANTDGRLTIETVSAYNTMMQYTIKENQDAMAKKTAYNSEVDLAMEPALELAIVKKESEYLALKEKPGSSSVELEYKFYMKNFDKDQGLMQIDPKLAIERYWEDRIKSGDAVLFIRQPLRNTNIGVEIVKEYAMELYEKYKVEIDKAKNDVVYQKVTNNWWYTEVYIPGQKYETRWCDPENMDRLMLYAIALEAYDRGGVDKIQKETVEEILKHEPTEYSKNVIEEYRNLIKTQR